MATSTLKAPPVVYKKYNITINTPSSGSAPFAAHYSGPVTKINGYIPVGANVRSTSHDVAAVVCHLYDSNSTTRKINVFGPANEDCEVTVIYMKV